MPPSAAMLLGHEYFKEKFCSLATKKTLAHGYLFLGPWGIGKFLFAEHLAGFVETGIFEPKSLMSDCLIIRPGEEGSIGIDAVREIKHFLWQMPVVSNFRTLIVNDAHLFTREAQNAVLKVAEEPSSHSLLLLVTHDPESLLPTLRSRLEEVYFTPVPNDALVDWLVEEEKMTKAKAEAFARNSYGKPGLITRRLHDEEFNKELEIAEKFLKTTVSSRRDIIKELAKDENFRLVRFLDMLILAAVEIPALREKRPQFLHELIAVRQNEDTLNLNTKIQLEYLSSLL